MGCGLSTMEPEESPAPLGPQCRRNRDGRVRRIRTRACRNSAVSTTDLLRSQADDVSEVASSTASPRKIPLPAEFEKRVVVAEEVKKDMVAVEEEEEDFPGSPSFRFYFQDTVDGAEVLDKLKKEDKSQEMDDSFVSVTSSEGSKNNSTNKVKGKRMRSLKGTNAVYSLFKPRDRCHPQQHHHYQGHSAPARVAPHPSDEKDA